MNYIREILNDKEDIGDKVDKDVQNVVLFLYIIVKEMLEIILLL